MRVIHTSKLSEVKSVFNSEADNVQYYNVLKNSNCSKLYNVELARPVLRKAKGEIIWQTDSKIEFRKLSDLHEYQRIKYGEQLEIFFKNFKKKVNRFSNISDGFVNKVMEIPNWDSILVNENEEYILIVNWGFLEDKFNRRDGIIETLFPVPDQSILVKLINEKGEPLDNQKLILILSDSERIDYTNTNGYARFGTLTRGIGFTIKPQNKELGAIDSFDFVCDGRVEYLIQVKEHVDIKIIVKDNQGNLLKNRSFYVKSKDLINKEFNTKQLGNFKFNHKIYDEYFEIRDQEDKIVLKEKLPTEDATFIISCEDNSETIDDSVNIDFDQDAGKEKLTLIYLNAFNKPLKSLDIKFEYKNRTFNKITDHNGEIKLDLDVEENEKLSFLFNRYNTLWNNSIELSPHNNIYIIKSKPIFPWLWWLLLLVLFSLLICCAFGNCFCNSLSDKNNTVDNNSFEEEVLLTPCDVETVSGGHGVTKTNHVLGDTSGYVDLLYNMENIPDKLEVYYQGKLVISTHEINGNRNGFVGGNLASGPTATLKFKYEKDNDDYVLVVVTGSEQDTAWEYLITCPK
jgi:hypothetical protein